MTRLTAHPLILISVAGSVLLSSCTPYLNTFYNATTAYTNARKAHEKLSRARPDTTITLTPAIQADYDTAISKSQKIFQNFPKQKKWHDDALLLMGKALFYKGELTRSIRRLLQLIDEHPRSALLPQAYLYLGRAYLEDGSLSKAEDAFALILQRYPELNRDQEISMLLAEIALRRDGKASAIALLEKARASVKDPTRKLQVLLRIAELYMDLKQYERAIVMLKGSPRQKEAIDLLVRVDLTLVSCYLATDSLNSALSVIDIMLKTKTYARYTPRILFKKGQVLSAMGKGAEARKVYEDLITRFPTDSLVGSAWFEVGKAHQKLQGDFMKARECYVKALPLLRDPDLKAEAQERIAAIDALIGHWGLDSSAIADTAGKSDSTRVRTDSTKTRDSTSRVDTTKSSGLDRYRIGEIFWLRLDEPDSALKYYSAIAADTSVGRDSVARALYAAGWITLSVKKDTVRADSIFGGLIAAFPANSFSKAAQQARGKDITVMTREDSAHASFVSIEKLLTDGADPLEIARMDSALYDSFPNTEYGLRALYASAWLYDFVLEKNKSAFEAYQKICADHPTSALCTLEARPRMRIVSDTLRVRQARAKAQARDDAKKQKVASKSGVKPSSADSIKAPSRPDARAADSSNVDTAAVVPNPQTVDTVTSAPPTPSMPADSGQSWMKDRGFRGRMMQKRNPSLGSSDSILHPNPDSIPGPR